MLGAFIFCRFVRFGSNFSRFRATAIGSSTRPPSSPPGFFLAGTVGTRLADKGLALVFLAAGRGVGIGVELGKALSRATLPLSLFFAVELCKTGKGRDTVSGFTGDGEERGDSGRLRSHGVASREENGDAMGMIFATCCGCGVRVGSSSSSLGVGSRTGGASSPSEGPSDARSSDRSCPCAWLRSRYMSSRSSLGWYGVGARVADVVAADTTESSPRGARRCMISFPLPFGTCIGAGTPALRRRISLWSLSRRSRAVNPNGSSEEGSFGCVWGSSSGGATTSMSFSTSCTSSSSPCRSGGRFSASSSYEDMEGGEDGGKGDNGGL